MRELLKMKKIKTFNILLLISFLITAITSLILFFFNGFMIGQFNRITFGLLHFYFGLATIVLALIHIILYWNHIFRKRK
jgi:hypothetical protein